MVPSRQFIEDGCNLILELNLTGVKAVPWKAPSSKSGIKKSTGAPYRVHYKNKRLTEFQDWVKKTAEANVRLLSRDKEPSRGPIHLELIVRRATKDEAKRGQWAYLEADEKASGFGDLRNIGKAIEDALQGVAFFRDSQVCSIRDRSFWYAEDSLTIRVYTINQNPVG